MKYVSVFTMAALTRAAAVFGLLLMLWLAVHWSVALP